MSQTLSVGNVNNVHPNGSHKNVKYKLVMLLQVQDLGGSKGRNNTQLRKEILELTDRVYHSWKEVRNTFNLHVASEDIREPRTKADSKTNAYEKLLNCFILCILFLGKQFIVTTSSKYNITWC